MRHINAWRLRRLAVAACGALIVVAITMFLTAQLGEAQGGTVELINGRADTSTLAVPVVLFVVGAVGLMAALGWWPEEK